MPPPRVLIRRAIRIGALLLFAALFGSIALVAVLRVIDPPTSAFIVRQALLARVDPARNAPVQGGWTPIEAIAPALVLAVVAAEDQRFPRHHGFDLTEMRRAWTRGQQGARLRGASTITQQTAKNLFLWPGRDWLRKGLEAWFTVLIETLWPKARILEIYLNIAQFGPEHYGVGAASWYYFDRPPGDLTRAQAARLAAALPNPLLYRVDAPSTRMLRRANRIEVQMRALGGGYLRELGM